VREQIFAYMFGATMFADAFIAAFRIPIAARSFREGALSTAFTTTFTKSGKRASFGVHLARLSSRRLRSSLCDLRRGMIFAPRCLPDRGGFENVPKFELTVRMTQLLFPFICSFRWPPP